MENPCPSDYLADTYLHALNPDGTLRWRTRWANNSMSAPAIGPDGSVYFAQDGRIIAVHPEDGRTRCYLNTRSYYMDGAAPTIGVDGTVYIGTRAGYLDAMTPDCGRKWTSRPYLGEWYVTASPAIGLDGPSTSVPVTADGSGA